MNVAWLVGLYASSLGALPPVEQPTPPSFDAPVDYLAWYRRQLPESGEGNAVEVYSPFMYGPEGKPAPMLSPSVQTGAAAQLSSILDQPAPWLPTQRSALVLWMAGLERQYMTPFREGMNRDRFSLRIDPGWKLLAEVRTPNLANGRIIGQARIAQAWRINRKTDFVDELPDAFGSILAYARHLSMGLTPTEQFFSAGLQSFVYEQVRITIPSRYANIPHWRRMSQHLGKYDNVPLTEVLSRSTFFAEALVYESLQRFAVTDPSAAGSADRRFDVDAFLEDRKQLPDAIATKADTIEALRTAEPAELAAAVGEYYRGMRAILDSGDGRNLAARLKDVESKTLAATPGLDALVFPLSMSVQTAFHNETTRRMLHLYLRMLIVHLKEITWPSDLSAFEGPDVEGCLIDPFSGEPFKTRMAKTGRLIYSVGPDGIDGKCQDETKDQIFLTVPPF